MNTWSSITVILLVLLLGRTNMGWPAAFALVGGQTLVLTTGIVVTRRREREQAHEQMKRSLAEAQARVALLELERYNPEEQRMNSN